MGGFQAQLTISMMTPPFQPTSNADTPQAHGGALLIIIALLLSSAAFPERTNVHALLQSAFVIVPGAKNVAHIELAGMRQQMSYRMDADYPARKVLEIITRTLRRRGWSPLRQDHFNPALPSSLVRGWTYYQDEVTQPTTSVRCWQADWRRQNDLVTYRLEYRCPGNACGSTRDLRQLQVIAIYAKHEFK